MNNGLQAAASTEEDIIIPQYASRHPLLGLNDEREFSVFDFQPGISLWDEGALKWSFRGGGISHTE